MSKKDEFIEKSIKEHGDKYDYSSVEYIIKKKVKIFCKICKKYFYQIPYHHCNGSGCQTCSKNKKLDTEEFIIKAKKKHLNKFDYSLVEYKNMHIKVKIICPIHGEFNQTPMSHLKNEPDCCSKYKKSNTLEFIEKSKKINLDKFDYSLTEYIASNKKVKIICNYHKYIFEQSPSSHKKHGCPLCGNINRRLKRIKEISINKFNGNQVIPSFNSIACDIFDKISIKNNIKIHHAMNGGEFYIEKLGYWVDGYDKENNTVYEYDEKHNFDKNDKLLECDIFRQSEIEKFLNCKFIRIKYSD
jgi:Zn finger protein HypA/HybF involved in hydrogenase expression